MARGYTYTCSVCGTTYTYCPKCELSKPDFDKTVYCSRQHSDIFSILSKHGCNLATAEETLEALKDYDLTGLTENIQAHIDSLAPEKAQARKEVVLDEEPTQE